MDGEQKEEEKDSDIAIELEKLIADVSIMKPSSNVSSNSKIVVPEPRIVVAVDDEDDEYEYSQCWEGKEKVYFINNEKFGKKDWIGLDWIGFSRFFRFFLISDVDFFFPL